MMFDWVSGCFPVLHKVGLDAGTFLSLTASGEIEFETSKRLTVESSHSNKIQLRTHNNSVITEINGDRWASHIYFDGNPVKFLQGHNLFGTNNISGLMYEFFLKLKSLPEISSLINLTPKSERALLSGLFELYRVDLTESFSLGSRENALATLRAMESTATMKNRGRGNFTGDTLYFGKKSKRSSIKIYYKGDELKAHKLHMQLQETSLPEWAEDKLRIELTLRSKQLKEINMNFGKNWTEEKTDEIYEEYMGKINIPANVELTDDSIEKLPMKLKPTYTLWKDGHDLRNLMTRPTFYRHRRELLKFDIDISIIQQSNKRDFDNVVPISAKNPAAILLTLKPAPVPDWAHGTELYLEPRITTKLHNQNNQWGQSMGSINGVRVTDFLIYPDIV